MQASAARRGAALSALRLTRGLPMYSPTFGLSLV